MSATRITFPLDPSAVFTPGSGDSLIGNVVPLKLHGKPAGAGTVVATHVEDGQLLVTMEVTGDAAEAVKGP